MAAATTGRSITHSLNSEVLLEGLASSNADYFSHGLSTYGVHCKIVMPHIQGLEWLRLWIEDFTRRRNNANT